MEVQTQRRTRAWWQCYSAFKRPELETAEQAVLDRGKYAHSIVQKMHPELNFRESSAFSDSRLDFDIMYHPDLHDRRNSIVWEIKSENFFVRNIDYCVAELSGYMHFAGARGAFLIYRLRPDKGNPRAKDIDGPWPFNPPWTYTWEELLPVAIAADKILLERGQ